jgi:hypothetical protein
MCLAHARCHGQQVQVVVAQKAGGAGAQAAQALEHFERGGSTVDEVTEDMKMIPGWAEVQGGQQPVEGVAAALDVANEVMHRPILLRCPATPLHPKRPFGSPTFTFTAQSNRRRPAWTLPFSSF